MNEKTTEHAYQVICKLKEECSDGVIKDVEMPSLVNTKTMKDIGFCVIIHLASKYDYANTILDDWKERLHADEYSVTVKRNQLSVKYTIRFD